MIDSDYVVKVAEALLSRCDGAVTRDDMGYNKFDARIVRQILSNPLDYTDILYLRSILLKYKRQIEELGFDYNKLLLDVDAWVENIDGNYYLCIKTPYHPDFVSQLRKLKERFFDWNRQINLIRITRDKRDALAALELLKKYFNYEPKLTLPDVSFGVVKGGVDSGNRILIFRTEYDERFIEEIRALHGRWNSSRKAWIVKPRNLSHIEKIKELIERWSITVEDSARQVLEELERKFREDKREKEELLRLSTQVETEVDIPVPDGLKLYPFQKVGYLWLEKTNGRALIADEMGLGKTVTVLAWLYNHPEIRPVLVICPNSVKVNWVREIKRWTGESAFVIRGSRGYIPDGYSFYVINYDILASRKNQLRIMDFKMVVLDESHYIKNYKAKRTEAALDICEDVKHVVCLTGTPILNRPAELWTTLKVLKPKDKRLRDFWTFMKRYADAKLTPWGWDFSGASNLDELQVLLRKTVMIRRLKKDVLKELPPKRRIMIPLEIDNRQEYENAVKNFRKWYYEIEGKILGNQAELLVRIEKLRQLAVKGKMQQVKQYIADVLENEEKVVVFAHHRDVQKELADEFKALQITGNMSAERKQKVIDEFNSKGKIIVVSMKAGSEGVNLQKSRIAIFTELGWTPSEIKQAEDRVHRIGQENQVDIYYLVAENTIEEYIWRVIQRKQKIIDEAIDGVADEEEKGILVEVVEDLVNK